ncbi:MAG: histidine kinase, partial [Acidobacteriia bacterium]|nr:histidine kinase [Terriglobia bacterium]
AASLRRRDAIVQLVIHDDGVGFDPDRRAASRKGKGGLGLLGMRERATSVGGTLRIRSSRRDGTEVELSVPVPSSATAPN